jgi:monoamine oxidase
MAIKQLESRFCVVGAGYAGLTAAYRLQQKKQLVTLLEAGSHVGGRVWTEYLSDGTPFDIGGAWVGNKKVQPDIRRLMDELNVRPYGQFTGGAHGKTVFVDAEHKISHYEPLNKDNPLETVPKMGIWAQLDLGATVFALNAMSEAVHLDSPWDDIDLPCTPSAGPKTTREADAMTVETWLKLNMSTAEARTLLTNAITGILGVSPGAASLLHLLFMLRSFDSSFLNPIGSGPGEAEEFRVRGGAQEMAKKMAAKLGDAVHLNSPVRQITQDARGVTVSSETVSVVARRVIVATGTAMANFIRFDPILPIPRAQLQQRMPQGECWKIWLCYDKAFWRSKGLNGESVSIADGDLIVNARDAGLEAGKDEPGLMNAFLAGDGAREFDRISRADRKKRVLKELVHRFGKEAGRLSTRVTFPAVPPQNPKPDSYFEWNWAMDEFTRGDFAAVPGPGVYTTLGTGPAIRDRFGFVHWAGVDTATYPYATFSGAVQSGERAAKEVLEAD